jgi:hypothetical protein
MIYIDMEPVQNPIPFSTDNKVIHTILSCTNIHQLKVAKKYLDLYLEQQPQSKQYIQPIYNQKEKSLVVE